MRKLLDWRVLVGIGAALAAVGAAATVTIRRRCASANAEVQDFGDADDEEDAQGTAFAKNDKSDANGRVTSRR